MNLTLVRIAQRTIFTYLEVNLDYDVQKMCRSFEVVHTVSK